MSLQPGMKPQIALAAAPGFLTAQLLSTGRTVFAATWQHHLRCNPDAPQHTTLRNTDDAPCFCILLFMSCSLTACVPDSHVGILGGAAGVGSEAMQKRPIHLDSSYSAALCSSNAAKTPYLYHTVRGDDTAGLPPVSAHFLLQYGHLHNRTL